MKARSSTHILLKKDKTRKHNTSIWIIHRNDLIMPRDNFRSWTIAMRFRKNFNADREVADELHRVSYKVLIVRKRPMLEPGERTSDGDDLRLI